MVRNIVRSKERVKVYKTFQFSKPGQEITQLILFSNLIFGLILHETIPGVVAQQFAAAAAAAEIAHGS